MATVLTAEGAVDHYLRVVLPADPPTTGHAATGRRLIDLTENATLIDHRDLAYVLDDPSRLRSYDRARSVDGRMAALLGFALWLYRLREPIPEDIRSRAARFRFLLWSLYFRLPEKDSCELLPDQVKVAGRPGMEPVGEHWLHQGRAAREEWLGYLNGWEDDPWLANLHTARPGDFETELCWLSMTWPTAARPSAGRWPFAPAALHLSPTEPDTAEATRQASKDHARIAADLADNHWLPRGALFGAATGFALGTVRGRLLPLAFPSLALVLCALLFSQKVDADVARWSALGMVGAGLLAAIVGLGDRKDSLALLRMPAAALVGLLALLSFTSRWWLDPHGWRVGAGLLAGALLYVVLELRLHGVRLWPALGRGALIGFIGTMYAFVLSLLLLGFVAPSVGEHGECLLGWWNTDVWAARPLAGCKELEDRTAAPAAGVLVLMTGWAFAAGLAAQILWDDRPVTAPLGRLRRVRGGRP